jgi:predicted HicB family RNase H-like nuclease
MTNRLRPCIRLVADVTEGMRMAKKNESIRFTVRVNETLHQQIANAAQRSERSLNSEIIHRLKRTFEREAFEAAA